MGRIIWVEKNPTLVINQPFFLLILLATAHCQAIIHRL